MQKKNNWFGYNSFFLFFLLTFLSLPAHAVFMVHDFYLPLPEAQIRATMLSLAPKTGTTLESIFSIVVTGPGTIIHYDQWEDGYETDVNNPLQRATQIWGDGNDANGTPPGYASDPSGLPTGAVIALRNLVSLPRNPAVFLYDARDRVTASKAIVVSRAAWATSPGSVLGCAVEVNATIDYGTSFVSPLGQNVAASSMFEYVGLFVMASENNTAVTIDTDGAGSAAPFTVTLNRGESYQVNGGVMKGATVISSKPIQAHLGTGDIGANYEARWFTLHPVEAWYSSYVTPVGTAADRDPCYVFVYNPGAAAITVNTASTSGSGSFAVAPGALYQWQVPQNSGALLSSAGGEPFFAMSTVGANPSANNVHDWGFSLIPADGLTSQAVVGWGPGSSDLSQNGSPVWVSPVAATRIYVDFDGDGQGALTDTNGKKYDAHYDLGALESKTLYDPDKDQTAMKLYTVDGVMFATAWGQDPAVAGAANPYLDLGTAVLPLPVPVIRKSSVLLTDNNAAGLSIGDVLEYTISVDNKGLLPLGNTLVLDTLPAQLSYVPGSTTLKGETLPDDAAGATSFPLDEVGYTIPIILRGGTSVFTYRTTIIGSGSIQNVASKPQYELVAENNVEVPDAAGSNPSTVVFTSGPNGTETGVYSTGSGVYLRLTDQDANLNSSTTETLAVIIKNETTGDWETVNLTETGPATGVFVNLAALPSSASSGLGESDGTLLANAGDALSVSYVDPLYGDSCGDTAVVAAESKIKPLYLTPDAVDGDLTGYMDRLDPVAAADATTSTSTLSVATGTVAVDGAASTGAATEGTSGAAISAVTVSHAVGTGANRLLLAGLSYEDDNTEAFSVTAVQWVAGSVTQSLTRVIRQTSSEEAGSEIWSLVAPNSGSGTLRVTVSGGTADSDAIYVGLANFTGVDQTAPLGTAVSATGTGTSASVTVNSVLGGLVFDTLGLDDARTATVGTGQTALWNGFAGTASSDGIRAAAGTKPGAASVTLSYTVTSDTWALCAVPIRPATVGVGAATFIQSPAFSSGFTLPSGGALNVVSYAYLASGTLAATPAITATLAYGGNTLATLTNPTATLAGGETATVTAASTSSAASTSTSGASSLTFSHTPGTGANRLLLVSVSTSRYIGNSEVVPSVTSVTFGGTAMTLVGSRVSSYATSYIYRLLNPASGAASVVISLSSAGSITAGATTFTGVNQSTPLGTLAANSNSSGSTSASVAVTSAANEVVFGTVAWDRQITVTVPADQTSLWKLQGAGYTGVSPYRGVSGAASTEPGATSVTHSYTSGSSQPWAILAVPVRPAAGSAIYRLDWSTTLGSTVTVPGGQALTLSVANNTGTAVSLLYDSDANPSRINLPASSVIDITSLGLYDAPYPGGNPVTAVAAGATVYVRATVSDPFGAYDITGLDLAIPAAGVSVSLTDVSAVASDAATKTYEYAFKTSAEGVYDIQATAHEGTEGITDSAAISLGVTFLDLGTPSITEFTVTDNGSSTNMYDTDQTVWVRVTDLDQNTNPDVAETVTATITGANGDAETVTLTETGPNTGVFTASIPAISSANGGSQNGTLYAPDGTALTVSYTDPTDSTDQSGAAAVVPMPTGTPGLGVSKTLVEPSDGQAVVGETVTFTITAANIGSTSLPSVALTDVFPAANLAYLSAVSAPDSVAAGTLTWSNIGPLAAGASKSFTVTFTAQTSSVWAVNAATADAGNGVTSTGTAGLTITRPAHTVVKTLVSPNPGPANYGETVTFRIAVSNSGDTAISILPLEDTFSAAYFEFVSATVPPDASGAGSLFWQDLTGAGSLAAGAALTFETSFRVVGGGNPADNTALAAYSLDVNGDPVPRASGAASLVTQAASISGLVWLDANTNGVINWGETGLADVTLALYTDPNGDGDPADGMLVQVTSTVSTNGYYEFMNLGTGNYVVVQSDLPGYGSVGDTQGANDNRIAIQVAASVSYAGNTFFDYVVSPVSYASVSGSVWNDASRNATNDVGESGLAGVSVQLVSDVNGNGLADPGEPVVASTQTGTNGFYTFSGLVAGKYVVSESDQPGYVSTGDAAGLNDNQAGVSVTAGTQQTGVDFYDVQGLTTIGNLVWEDLNGNGVQEAGEPGISGVTVGLYDSASNLLQTVQTGAAGAYAFTNIAQGIYVLRTTAPAGYAASTRYAGGEPALDSDMDPAGWSGAVTVAAGAERNDFDFGLYVPAMVEGYLFKDKDGNDVRNTGDATLIGLEVRLVVNGAVIATTMSDGSGYYKFEDVPAGTVSVLVSRVESTLADVPDSTDPMRNRAVADAAGAYAVIVYTVLSGQGVVAGRSSETLNFGFTAVPLSTALDITLYATADGVMIDVWTVNESGNGDIVISAWINNAWVEIGCVPSWMVAGESSNRYSVRATGLSVDGSYLIRIVDEAGHVHFSNAPVAVKAIRMEAVRLNMKTLTLSFNTEYGRQYVVKVSTNLVDWSIEYVSYQQAAGWTEYVNTPFTAGPGSKTEVIVPVNGRKQAFFKIERVDE